MKKTRDTQGSDLQPTKLKSGKAPKLTKGTSSAVLLSILIHAGLFLIATTLVVFTVISKKEQAFEPPKTVERPKMKLKKPRVQIKKSSRPKSTTRIATKVRNSAMPNIELPAMSGMGDGLGDAGLGDFTLMPDVGLPSLLGSGQSIGSDLEGTFYDFKRNRNGTGIPYSQEGYREIVRKFIKSGWRTSELSRYYRSPRKLYATTIVVPTVLSEIAPQAFGENVEGNYWMVHYTGQLVCHRDITFRFVGSGDEMLVVRVNGEIVMGVAWWSDESRILGDIWTSEAAETDQYWLGNQTATLGDWVTLEAGVPVPIEILGTDNGGQACLMLGMEEQGVEYPMRRIGGPTFPVFRTAELSLDMMDIIYQNMVEGELDLTNGPVFNDFQAAPPAAAPPPANEPAPVLAAESPMRTWVLADGRAIEGEYKSLVGTKAVIETKRGGMQKVDMKSLSETDREYIELANPPRLKLGVSNVNAPRYTIREGAPSGVVQSYRYTYTGKARQESNATYSHPLTVEFFAVGAEIHGDQYILLDRQSETFIPSPENDRSVSITGREVELPNFILEGIHRGVEHFGYLITVKDKRGEIIEYKTTAKWLYEHLDALEQMPVGRFMDRSARRVFPTGPKRTRY